MPIQLEDFHSELYDLLKTRGLNPIPLNSVGEESPFYPEADIFKFSFVQDGKKQGDAWATVEDASQLVIYYDDAITSNKWFDFIAKLKTWAQSHNLAFELRNSDHLVGDMQKREYIKKKEKLGESYHPISTKKSWNDSIPKVKIVIQHSKQLGEGEQRFRHVEKIFVENTEGERFAVPTKKPGLAKVYARHVAEGGTPYDERGKHLTSLIEQYNKMVGFMRATKNGNFAEDVQRIVEAGRDHYQSLRETLGKLIGHRGYNAYFESWTPVLNEELTDTTTLTNLFVTQKLDPRIESCIPILSKLVNLEESKPVNELETWADTLISETTGLTVETDEKAKILQHLKSQLPNSDEMKKAEVIKFGLPESVKTLALEWLEWTVQEDGPEQERVEEELEEKGFSIDFSDDARSLELTHNRTGKVLSVEIPVEMQTLVEQDIIDESYDWKPAVWQGKDLDALEPVEYFEIDGVSAGDLDIDQIKDISKKKGAIRWTGNQYRDGRKSLVLFMPTKIKAGDKIQVDIRYSMQYTISGKGYEPYSADIKRTTDGAFATVYSPELVKPGKNSYTLTYDKDLPESLSKNQEEVGQLGPTQRAKTISPVLGKAEKPHPFQGKLVGASESIDLELQRIKSLSNTKKD